MRSEEEFEQILSQLRELDNADPDSRYLHSVAEIPALILDPKEKACRYIDTNGFVEDSFALERERKSQIVWTDEEKDIFIKKYVNIRQFAFVLMLICIPGSLYIPRDSKRLRRLLRAKPRKMLFGSIITARRHST